MDPLTIRFQSELNSSSDQVNEWLKKSIQRTDKNMMLLEMTLASYVRNEVKQLRKTRKLAQGGIIDLVLDLVAQQEAPQLLPVIQRITQVLNERERYREQMTARTQAKTVDLIRSYPRLCQGLLTEVKRHKQALNHQAKKRKESEQATLKNTGDGNSRQRMVVCLI